ELLVGLPGGLLAEPGDVSGLAEAMARQLDNPLPATELSASVEAYTVENSVASYLAAMGLPMASHGV
ncbi:MAG: hypothetical protein KZQ82_21055, partial [Candidatus Thiodiazotropha sp. (ex Lucinoma annulata)]|nr:hypothetical protein [Candidatus Thiodiazotropha sp. (ex Lucinoma annulata)]